MKFCPECGNKLVEGAKFCPECGYKIFNENDSNEKLDSNFAIKKVSSEAYIKRVLSESSIENSSVAPDIDEKLLITAAKTIAMNINPSFIIGIINTALLGKGKTGIVFTGSDAYIRGSFDTSIKISYEGISNVKYDLERKMTDKGKMLEIQFLTIDYLNGNSIRIDSQKLDASFPFNFLAQLLKDFDKNVDKIEVSNQVIQLTDLGPEIIELYFKAIIIFLKSDDYKISSEEYKELVTLMTKVKVTKPIAKKLRDYRFSENIECSFSEMVSLLRKELNEQGVSYTVIYQSLAMDIISMNKNRLKNWKDFDYIVGAMESLEINKKQVEFIVLKIESEERLISERLDDKQVGELTKELAAVASGAGVSLGALAVTGAVTGWGAGISGGLFALVGSGGTLIGLAAIAGAGYGVYKGVKYFSGTSELEKSGIRINALTVKIEQLRAANAYIIDDINWLVGKISSFANKLQESEELNSEVMNQMIAMISQSQNVAESGSLVEKDQENAEYEYLIANLPKKLDVDKYEELISKDINHELNDLFVKEVYLPLSEEAIEGSEENIEALNGLFLNEAADFETLSRVRQILENIRYFDTKASAAAQSKVVAKKAKAGLKSLFGGE